jgi:hypothetical protein
MAFTLDLLFFNLAADGWNPAARHPRCGALSAAGCDGGRHVDAQGVWSSRLCALDYRKVRTTMKKVRMNLER